MIAPFPVLSLTLVLLPSLIAMVGLCLAGMIPRQTRATAIPGLILLALVGPLETLLHLALSQFPTTNGLYQAPALLGHLFRFLTAVGFLLVAFAATRGRAGLETGPPSPPPHAPGHPTTPPSDRSRPPFPGGA